jgi:guanylate kinase
VTERSGVPPADLPRIPPGPPLVIVLSGPSGIGKDSVRELLMRWRLPVHFAVTATNRAPRPGEVDGIDYHFLSDAGFDRLEASGELIESAIVYGQKKGVPRSEIEEPLSKGRDVIARLDVQGAATLRNLFGDTALLIFIAPPSQDEAQRRLEERDTEPEAERQARLAAAEAEMEAAKDFDYVVVNATGELEKTARRVVEIIAEEKARRPL